MRVLSLDLGGTKLASAVFNDEGSVIFRKISALGQRSGSEAGDLITEEINSILASYQNINSMGISVPGIYDLHDGTVWAPNIPGWEKFPLLQVVKKVAGDIPITVECDRACYIMGEAWQGNARGCLDAIFISVGTGIGAGIMINGNVLRGSKGISGATGWMALQKPFISEYYNCGCFEYYASGEGIARNAVIHIGKNSSYNGELRNTGSGRITAHDVFGAFENGDLLAGEVIRESIEYWGMATANLISLFNPEKIIFGGGVFGPAVSLIEKIREEAEKWAQPVSMKMVSLETSALGGDAGIYGAAYLAINNQKGNA